MIGKTEKDGCAKKPGGDGHPEGSGSKEDTKPTSEGFGDKNDRHDDRNDGRADQQCAVPGEVCSVREDGVLPVRDTEVLAEEGMPAVEDENRRVAGDLRGEERGRKKRN